MTEFEIEAGRKGLNWEFKVGDLFLGAWGECDRLGYPEGSLARKLFTSGYLLACREAYPGGVPVDKDERITEEES